MKLTFYDKLLAMLIVFFSIALFVLNITTSAGPARQYVNVYVDNALVMEFSIDESTEKVLTFPFGPAKEHLATLEISAGKVRMLPISRELCPRGICAHTGWITRDYQSIVCIPNRIVISFRAQKDNDIDGVTF